MKNKNRKKILKINRKFHLRLDFWIFGFLDFSIDLLSTGEYHSDVNLNGLNMSYQYLTIYYRIYKGLTVFSSDYVTGRDCIGTNDSMRYIKRFKYVLSVFNNILPYLLRFNSIQ